MAPGGLRIGSGGRVCIGFSEFRTRNKAALAAVGLNDAVGFQLSIRPGDRVGGETQINSELAHSRQFVARCELALGRARGDLATYLFERWLDTRHINGELTHTAILP